MKSTPMIGEVYMMNFQGIGCEQLGWRPGVVFQNNIGNFHSPNIIAIPLTTAIKKVRQPTHVILSERNTGLDKSSMALCESLQCLSKERLGRYITTLPANYMREIAIALLSATAALSFLSEDDLSTVHQKALYLNPAVQTTTDESFIRKKKHLISNTILSQ